jgi:hypothetical protein
MLIGISALLGPEFLAILSAMGNIIRKDVVYPQESA